MKIYLIRITTDKDLSRIIKYNTFIKKKGFWEYEIKESDKLDFANIFMEFYDKNKDILFINGISKRNISIWILYEYEEICSLSISAKQMKILGEKDFCINIDCWKKNDYINLSI